jgi:hypothetical protein
VDDLCKRAPSLWAGRKILGIVAAARADVAAATWENNIHTLCIKEKRTLSTGPAAMTDNDAEHLPEIYPSVMYIRGS